MKNKDRAARLKIINENLKLPEKFEKYSDEKIYGWERATAILNENHPNKIFSDSDILFLEDNYLKHGIEYCMARLKKTKRQIFTKAENLGLKLREKGKDWTPDEILFLKENYCKPNGNKICVEHLGRSRFSVAAKASELEIKTIKVMKKVWSDEMISFLKKNYQNHGAAFCAGELNLSLFSVQVKAQRLNLGKGKIGHYPRGRQLTSKIISHIKSLNKQGVGLRRISVSIRKKYDEHVGTKLLKCIVKKLKLGSNSKKISIELGGK